MTAKEIWESHPKFKQYEYKSFKQWNASMKKMTTKRREQVDNEENAFQNDMLKFPKNKITSRYLPFWNDHPASKLLEDDVSKGMSKMWTPTQLWKSRKEYQDFPLPIFRKHIYVVQTKQLAAPYWQHKRNLVAQKKQMEEATKLKSEWNHMKWNDDMETLVQQWGAMKTTARRKT